MGYLLSLLIVMASSSESSLLNIKKLQGAANYPMWKKMVLNVLILRQFHAPIVHEGVKPKGMSDDAWALADLSAKSIIELSLHESVVWNVDSEKRSFTMDIWKL